MWSDAKAQAARSARVVQGTCNGSSGQVSSLSAKGITIRMLYTGGCRGRVGGAWGSTQLSYALRISTVTIFASNRCPKCVACFNINHPLYCLNEKPWKMQDAECDRGSTCYTLGVVDATQPPIHAHGDLPMGCIVHSMGLMWVKFTRSCKNDDC